MAASNHLAETTTPILFVLLCLSPILSAMPTPAPPENATQLRLNEVLIGAKTLDRFVTTQMTLGSFYNGSDNDSLERGLYTFSILLNTFNTLSSLGQYNLTSADLSIFKIVINGMLDDACHWLKTYNEDINCEDRASLITLFLSFSLKPHLDNMMCFLTKTLGNFSGDQSSQAWITRTFATTPFQVEAGVKCQLCGSLNLGDCCTASK